MALALVLLALINHERIERGDRPLVSSPVLMQEAQGHRGTLHTRVLSCPIGVRGQNLAWGQPTPREAVAAWMASPEHRANILEAKYHYTGFGISTTRGLRVYVEDFCQTLPKGSATLRRYPVHGS